MEENQKAKQHNQSQEKAHKQIRQMLKAMANGGDTSEQRMGEFRAILQNVNERQRPALVKRLGEIMANKADREPQVQVADEPIAHTLQQPQKNKFETLNTGVTGAEEPKALCAPTKLAKILRGSQCSSIAMQNTILSGLIEGYQAPNAHKRFYSLVQANGVPAVFFLQVRLAKIPDAFKTKDAPRGLSFLSTKAPLQTTDDTQAQDQATAGSETVWSTKSKQEKKEDESKEAAKEHPSSELAQDQESPFTPCVEVGKQFFQNVISPPNASGRQSELLFVQANQELQENGYSYQLNAQQPEWNGEVIGLDCEMVQTGQRNDLSLARVTVISASGAVVFDELCKPTLPIIDYLTQYSGIKPGDLDNAQSQDELIKHLLAKFPIGIDATAQPIVCGHGLDNDFRCMGICPQLVMDTAIQLSDGNYKKKLRQLASQYLQVEIQQKTEGHDSAEDAIAALNLCKAIFYAFGSTQLQEKYQDASEAAERILKHFKKAGEPIAQRLASENTNYWRKFRYLNLSNADQPVSIPGFQTLQVNTETLDLTQVNFNECRILCVGDLDCTATNFDEFRHTLHGAIPANSVVFYVLAAPEEDARCIVIGEVTPVK